MVNQQEWITSELLKSGEDTKASVLHSVFRRILEERVIPRDWEEGLLDKGKKG